MQKRPHTHGYKPREFGSIHRAILFAMDKLGPEHCLDVMGMRNLRDLQKYSDASDAREIPVVRAVRLDRELMLAPEVSPEDRLPACLLAMAYSEGLEIDWRPRRRALDAHPVAGNPSDLMLRLMREVGAMSDTVQACSDLPGKRDIEALASSRDRIIALVNDLIDAAVAGRAAPVEMLSVKVRAADSAVANAAWRAAESVRDDREG